MSMKRKQKIKKVKNNLFDFLIKNEILFLIINML